MCGRYVSVTADSDLTLEFDVDADDVIGDEVPPSYNVAPTDPARIVLERVHRVDGDLTRQLRTARWGLVPSWSKDARGGARMINARVETVTHKPAFRKAAARRRCLVPAQGYYEWQQTDSGKTPFFLHDPGGELLAFAGLYELWRDPTTSDNDDDRWLWTYTIITRQATDLLGEIHDRTPVLVPSDAREQWLDCTSDDPATAQHLLDAFAPPRLEPYEVGTAVGNVRNNGPHLLEPAARPPEQQSFGF